MPSLVRTPPIDTLQTRRADFDRIARVYRWLEYVTFGPLLQRTRLNFLSSLHTRRRALLLGDGDGRFTARLLALYPHLAAEAVDTSDVMLNLLRSRSEPFSSPSGQAAAPPRLQTHKETALGFRPKEKPDLVVTHFFLDCLTQPELNILIQGLAPHLAPDTLWLVSEFRIPPGIPRLPARLLIRALYLAFRVFTGLRVAHLPLYAPMLADAGFTRIAQHHRLFGVLTSELWQRESAPKPS